MCCYPSADYTVHIPEDCNFHVYCHTEEKEIVTGEYFPLGVWDLGFGILVISVGHLQHRGNSRIYLEMLRST
jgi:hypothetical protein